MTDQAAASVEEAGMLYLRSYMRLAEDALKAGRPRYKVRPKVHSFHCETLLKIRSGSKLNPRFHSCFNDEDYVGRVCAVGKQSCHPSTMSRRLLERILLQTNTSLMEKNGLSLPHRNIQEKTVQTVHAMFFWKHMLTYR